MNREAVFLGLFTALAASSCLALLVSVRRRPWPGRVFGWRLEASISTCHQCGYSLEGLAAASPCPECGTSTLDMVPRKLVVNPTVLRRLWLVILVNIATLFILHPAAYWGLIHAYMRDGFDAERATRWIPMREFGQASGLYAPPISLMYPLMIATTVVFPLCILLPHRRWWIALAVLWPLAFIGSVWRIAQYC